MVLRSERIVPIGMKKETSFGETPTASAQTLFPDIIESMDGGEEVDWKQIWTRGGDREMYQLVEGKHVAEFTANGIVQTGRWIAMAMGKDVVTGASDPFTHTITRKNGMPFPSWVMEAKYVDAASLSVYIKGLTVDALTLSGGEEDLLKFTASIKAHSAIKNTGADSSVTLPTTEPFQFHEGIFTYFGSVISRVTDFEAVIQNSGQMLYPYDSTSGKFPKEYIPKRGPYELRTTVVPVDTTFFDTLKNAASNLTCTLKFTRASSPEDSLQLQFTNCGVRRADHPIPEEGEVRIPLEIIPRSLTATILNATSTSYADTS